MKKIGIINDEISNHLSTSFLFCKENNLDYINLRSKDNINVINWTLDDFLLAKELSEYYEVAILGIMSPLFKSSYLGSFVVEKNIDFPLSYYLDYFDIEEFEQWISTISVCKPSFIRMFSPLKTTSNEIERWSKTLISVKKISLNYSIGIAIENEPACQLSSYLKVVDFIKSYEMIDVKIVWDPGNDLSVSDKSVIVIPDINQQYITEIHLKDWCHIKQAWVPLGQGSIPLRDIISNNRIQNLCLETHIGKNTKEKIVASTQSLITLRKEIENSE